MGLLLMHLLTRILNDLYLVLEKLVYYICIKIHYWHGNLLRRELRLKREPYLRKPRKPLYMLFLRQERILIKLGYALHEP
jgi:hypothetical protein